MTLYTVTDTPLGRALLACDGSALTGLWLEGQKYYPTPLLRTGLAAPDHPLLRRGEDWLRAYFAGARPDPWALPLAPQGTVFQRQVWAKLRDIPYGERVTYGALARALGERTAPRAVGQAVGRNPILLLIPCHRVVGAGGTITGFAAGVDRKRWLLDFEGRT